MPSSGQRRRLVHKVRQVSSYHSHCRTCDGNQVYIRTQGYFTRVDFEYGQASIPVWSIHRHTPVKATWAQQRYVKPIRTVGGTNNNNCLACIEPIPLYQYLVQCLSSPIGTLNPHPSPPPYPAALADDTS